MITTFLCISMYIEVDKGHRPTWSTGRIWPKGHHLRRPVLQINLRAPKIIAWLSSTTFLEWVWTGRFFFQRFFFQIKLKVTQNYSLYISQ